MSELRRTRQAERLATPFIRRIIIQIKLKWKQILAIIGVQSLLDLFREYGRAKFMDSVYDKLGSFGQWLLTYPFAMLTIGIATVLLILVVTAIRESHIGQESSILGVDGHPLIIPPRISKAWSAGFSIAVLICVAFIGYGAYVYYSVSPQALLHRYPLGYVFFNGEYESSIFPYGAGNHLEEWTFDWRTVKILHNTENRIVFQIPDIYINGRRAMSRNSATVNKEVREFILIDFGNTKMLLEILKIRKDSIVFLIGFR
jgi:hypothetical protein